MADIELMVKSIEKVLEENYLYSNIHTDALISNGIAQFNFKNPAGFLRLITSIKIQENVGARLLLGFYDKDDLLYSEFFEIYYEDNSTFIRTTLLQEMSKIKFLIIRRMLRGHYDNFNK